jgi:hypothetical protein
VLSLQQARQGYALHARGLRAYETNLLIVRGGVLGGLERFFETSQPHVRAREPVLCLRFDLLVFRVASHPHPSPLEGGELFPVRLVEQQDQATALVHPVAEHRRSLLERRRHLFRGDGGGRPVEVKIP